METRTEKLQQQHRRVLLTGGSEIPGTLPGSTISLPVVVVLGIFYTTRFALSFSPSHAWLHSQLSAVINPQRFNYCQKRSTLTSSLWGITTIPRLQLGWIGPKKAKWLTQRFCNSTTSHHKEISSFLSRVPTPSSHTMPPSWNVCTVVRRFSSAGYPCTLFHCLPRRPATYACWLPVTFLLVNNCIFFHLNPAL